MLWRLLPLGEHFYFLPFSGEMDGLCLNATKSNKLPVGRAVNKQGMGRTNKSYCLFGNNTCPFKHPEQKGGVVVVDLLCLWVRTHCRMHACVTSHKEQRCAFSSEAEALTSCPVQLNYLHPDNKLKKQHLNNLWGIHRQETGRSNSANSFLCPFLKFPFDRRAHLGMGASKHFKESPLFWWIFGGHGPRQAMG